MRGKLLKKLRMAAVAVFPVLFVAAFAFFGVKGLTAAAEKRARTAAMRHIATAERFFMPKLEEETVGSKPGLPGKPDASPKTGSGQLSSSPEPAPSSSRVPAPEKGSSKKSSGRMLPVKNILQLPELKAGCEVTSTAIVLNYFGCSVKKTELVDYLSMDGGFHTVNGKLYGPDPWKVFAGRPDDKYGCYAPVVTKMANRYLRDAKSGLTAVDISGAAPLELYSCIDSGFPVIVWATTFLQEPSVGPEWYLNDTGEYYQWILREHCLVLKGYTDQTVTFCDPLDERGTVTYDRSLFELRYSQMYSQAVLIH